MVHDCARRALEGNVPKYGREERWSYKVLNFRAIIKLKGTRD
jgi:hypothetical protein